IDRRRDLPFVTAVVNLGLARPWVALSGEQRLCSASPTQGFQPGETWMAGRSYRLRISRGDTQFEAEGDKAFVLEMLKRFDAGNTPGPREASATKTGKADAAALASSKSMSVGEFIRQVGLKKHTDLTLAFGYYLEHHSGLKEFTVADI